MSHPSLARDLLAAFCGIQGIATMAIDLNRTHATNPLWPGHARFHLVWQVVGAALLSVFEILLILWPGPAFEERFFMAAILTSIPMLAFLVALLFRRAYDGTLQDPNGIPPARFSALGREWRIDMNVFAAFAGLLVVTAILLLHGF